jgi:hypothetical protein
MIKFTVNSFLALMCVTSACAYCWTILDGDSVQFKPARTSAQQFYDPAIMSARFVPPIVQSPVPDEIYTHQPVLDNHHLAYGPPPGLSFPPQNIVPASNVTEPSQPSTATHGELLSLSYLPKRGVPGQYRACFPSARQTSPAVKSVPFYMDVSPSFFFFSSRGPYLIRL